MDLTSTDLTTIFIVVVVAVIVVGMLLYLRQQLRRKRAQLLRDLEDRPELIQDRAFNRIAMARREAELLVARGSDVARARELIATAQASFDSRRYEAAYQSAQLAHESLVHARKASPLPSSSSKSGPEPTPVRSPEPDPIAPPAAAVPVPGIAKNRAESKFQLTVLDRELERARHDGPEGPTTAEATALQRDAQTAFDRSDYTEAFRLALRGRRALGGSVESLPPSPGARAASTPRAVAPDAARPLDASAAAERVAGADRCSACGYPTLPGDTFCRGCGKPHGGASCPACGTPRTSSDTFCGRCGTRFD